ncbi:MAG TPA: CRISPR-associated protein Csx11 [Blastocatellia bacterium]|nr:CRISPR-associated protein Csx11 [Blastocatellia bacterium]
MTTFTPADTLRQHRPVLLACEAIGWFHMAGKARLEFLRQHGGDPVRYEYEKWHDAEQPPFPWDNLLGWVKGWPGSAIPQNAWPGSFKEFTEKHRERNLGMLGLLQASHGIVSGIEKNVPSGTSEYLNQSLPHMWLSSPFGNPQHNLFADPPEVLTERGWKQVVGEILQVLEELGNLATHSAADVRHWAHWREQAIGPQTYLRQAFLSTVAETRLPNNDVTLWDQSYVAAALFKSAVAGAVLDQNFPWGDGAIKQRVRWRLLTVAIGADHYEARAVKIGDWTGMQGVLEQFFGQVRQLIEVDLAAGSLLYQDSSVAVFSFPGERFDETPPAPWLNGWESWLQEQVEGIAQGLHLETPPLVRLSEPTRSLVPQVQERQEARTKIAIPLHKAWYIPPRGQIGHICPVCQVRLNGNPANKDKPCEVCQDRRSHRRDDWLRGRVGYDTIWFEEVTDRNGRITLLTLAFDLEPWLSGERVDSLRAQAISEWSRFNPVLSEFWQRDASRRRHEVNPIQPVDMMNKLVSEVQVRLRDSSGQIQFRENDLLLANLQEGYRHVRSANPQHSGESSQDWEQRLWKTFFRDIVEDRARAPAWDKLNDKERAAWLAHQLFCKLPSPGRVYRFWREAEEVFEELLKEFRQIAARSDNPWRVRRLLIEPDASSRSGWQDRMLYDGRWRDVQLSLVYVRALDGFVTASNLARLLKPEESGEALRNQQILLEEEDTFGRPSRMVVGNVKEMTSPYSHLGVYHPVIPLELSPLRFRVVLPLEAASECAHLALSRWREQFARVWDRLPMHIAIIAFDRTLPFQAVMEAARNLEDRLSQGEEVWTVERHEEHRGIVALQLRRRDGQTTLQTVPIRLADGREDVFYPYIAVEDRSLRYPKDFRHPNGQVYRHVSDLRIGDGVKLFPAHVGFLFMETTGARFEALQPLYAEDWEAMREIWKLVERTAPSQTALQRFRSALYRLEGEWRDSPDQVSPDLWRDTVRALIVDHLEAKGAALEVLTEAACRGLLQRTLEWYMTTLRINFQGD